MTYKGIFIIYFLVVALLMSATTTWVCLMTNEDLKLEAIDRGYAEWIITREGSVKWQWKELK